MEFLSSTFAPLLNLPHDPVFKYIFIAINVISIICWVLSLITQNFSQIDKIWSIEPALFAWVFLFTSIYFNGASTSNNPRIPGSIQIPLCFKPVIRKFDIEIFRRRLFTDPIPAITGNYP